MATPSSAAVVTGPDGAAQSLGAFLRACKRKSGMPVTRIAEKAGVSRANFYLLEKDNQRPTLGTLVGLFGAMGLASRIPTESEPAATADLVVTVGEEEFQIDLQWSAVERSKSRERYLSAASTGLGAALGVLGSSLGRHGNSQLPPPAAGNLGPARLVVAAAPIVLPSLGAALTMAARNLRERRASEGVAEVAAPPHEEVLASLTDTAATMSTEELEALLAAMKAMHASYTNAPEDGSLPS